MISIRDICKAKAVGDRVLLNKLSLMRVLELQTPSSASAWAMVTAERFDASDEENSSGRTVIANRVRNLGYGYSRLDGLWTRKLTDPSGNDPDSRFIQRVLFIHGISLKHTQRLLKSQGEEKALFGQPDGSIALIEPEGSITGIDEVSSATITEVWGDAWSTEQPDWKFQGFELLPQGFIENLIQAQFCRNIKRIGLDAVLSDQDLQPPSASLVP